MFVHGIGAQLPGSTLQAWSQPLRERLQELASANAARHDAGSETPGPRLLLRLTSSRGEERAEPEPHDTPVAALGHDSDEGHRFEIWTLSGETGSGYARRRWLLTESCWARSFVLPSQSRVQRWQLMVFARFVLLHWMLSAQYAMARIRAQPSGPRQPLRLAFVAVQKYLYGALLIVSLFGRGLASYFAYSLIFHDRRMPDLVGDSLAALTDEAASSSMRSQIARDLDWSLRKVGPAGTVTVVAHSQGAMLVRDLLAASRDPEHRKRVRLMTVGSGILLLQGLKGGEDIRASLWAWLSLFAMTVWLTFIFIIIALLLSGSGPGVQGLVAFVLLPLAAVIAAKRAGLSEVLPALRRLGLRDRVCDWTDVSSRFDPVCFGPLLSEIVDDAFEVANGPTLLQEHSRYHRNATVHLLLCARINDPSTIMVADEDAYRAWSEAAYAEMRSHFVALRRQVVGCYLCALVAAAAALEYVASHL
jgi:hypothetical protein